MSEFEAVIEELGSFGPYQIRVFVLVSLFETPAAWAMLLPVFTHAKPETWCTQQNGHSTTPSHLNYTDRGLGVVSLGNDTREVHNQTVCSAAGSTCQGLTYSQEFTSIVSEWGLMCDYDYIPSLITTLQMVGVLIGACITGQLADMFGRRKTLYIVYCLLLIMGFASAFSNSWQLYATFRFLIGVFFGGTMVVNFVLPLEFVGPKWRTFCGCIGFWACGVMSLALMAYLIRDWRHLTIAASVGGILLPFTWWFVPESPRWLLQKGHMQQAQTILTDIAQFNKKSVPDFSKLHIFAQREQARRAEDHKYSYWDLFRTPSLCRNTLIALYAWFVSSTVYYGTNFNIRNLAGDRYLNMFVSGAVEIPALVVVVVINNWMGRKKTLFSLFFLAGISCIGILILDSLGYLESLSAFTVTLAMIGRSGIAGGWAAAQVFSAEVFPTVVRNIGIASCSMAARIGGIVAPQLVFLDKVAKPLPFTVFGGLSLVCSFLCLLLPETLNKPLPDALPPRQYWCCHQATEPEESTANLNGMVPDGDGNNIPLAIVNGSVTDKKIYTEESENVLAQNKPV